MFQAAPAPAGDDAPRYCCQDDGMVGLGCGARSYTRSLHYSGEYAVGASGVRGIIAKYLQRQDFSVADYGFRLDGDEQRRRYVLKSLLRADGLDLAAYQARFGTDARHGWPLLAELEAQGLAVANPNLCLTPPDLELSGALGPLFYSPRANALMRSYQWT
jgi:oxygen-independent coproporphyrinogen-3 oxidase